METPNQKFKVNLMRNNDTVNLNCNSFLLFISFVINYIQKNCQKFCSESTFLYSEDIYFVAHVDLNTAYFLFVI